jgi:hypothetical protein
LSQHDCVINNGTGTAVLADMNAALKALASCQSGAVAPTTTYPGMFWLDTSIPPDGFLRQRNRANTAWVQVLGLPPKATEDVAAAGTDTASYLTAKMLGEQQGAWLNFARNRLVNPAFQISQENASNAGGNGWYAADQWLCAYTQPSLVASYQRVKVGTRYKLRVTVTTAGATPVGAEYFAILQRIEGTRIADFRFGTAQASKVIVRLGFRGPAGTYGVALRNGARCYANQLVITAAQANLDQIRTFEIPGDIAGTWGITEANSIELWITFAAGPTYQAAPNVWTAGAQLAPTGMTNGAASTANIFEIYDVGLYLDVTGTGQPPPFKEPDEAKELLTCQRYYVMEYTIFCQNTGLANTWYGVTTLPVDLRIATPTMTQEANSGNSTTFPTTSTYAFVAPRTMRVARLSTAGGTAQLFHEFTNVSARM